MATAIEYGLIASLIAVAVIGGVVALGENSNQTFDTVSQEMKDTSPVVRRIPVKLGQEGAISFADPASPSILHEKDGDYTFACPLGMMPVPANDISPENGRCVSQ